MTTLPSSMTPVDSSWQTILMQGLSKMDSNYLEKLSATSAWLPGAAKIFNAFSAPLSKINYVLFGESPYPRPISANGYAFWDAAVTDLWSTTGLNKKVNRATSLRNIIKMLLVTEGLLTPARTRQEDIAALNKQSLITTNQALFTHLLDRGFLLLNASLVLQAHSPRIDAHYWQPFIYHILHCLYEHRPEIKFLLLGNIAHLMTKKLPGTAANVLIAEHPYNLSFITNPKILNFFHPFHLLLKN